MKKLLLALMLTVCSFNAAAQPGISAQQNASSPYREVSPEMDKYTKTDKRKVLLFISFTCEFCKNLWPTLYRWGGTLPSQMEFEVVPVVMEEDRGSLVAASMWYAAVHAGATHDQLMEFANQAFRLIQTEGRNPSDPAIWGMAARAAGIANMLNGFKLVKPDEVVEAGKKLAYYQISATPSVAIAGHYILTPDNANGDVSTYIQLLNGMVSRVIGYK